MKLSINRFGFIAQEIETVFPNLICNKEDEDLQHQIDSLKK